MKEGVGNPKLILEETKAIKFFIWLFYLFFLAYDIYSYFLVPSYLNEGQAGIPKNSLGIWFYVILIGYLPMAVYFIKKGNPYIVKYMYLFGYLLLEIINNLLIYMRTDIPYGSGNVVELLFVFISPIFVNKRYFFVAALSMIGKYLFLGSILQESRVIIPIITFIILSAIAFFLLTRFLSYIKSLMAVNEELRQKEKLAVIGQMAAAIGHEIRNPLSSLKGFTQLQQEHFPNTNEYYPIMIQEIDRINSIVNDLMYLGKPKDIHFTKGSIEEIIAYTLSITEQQASRQGVSVETTIAGSLPPLECDPKQLKQVFINLIKNAIESMPNGGQIKIGVKVLEGNKMHICIKDEGSGIDDESLDNLGEPFYTTKKDGTGLGLMVTNQIIRDHNGDIKISSELGEGTQVSVILPISQLKK